MKRNAKAPLNPEPTYKERLIAQTKRGGVTLVVGAGISVARGIPNWNELAQAVWKEAFGARKSPWAEKSISHSPMTIPQFLPIVFELVYRKLGEGPFMDLLRKHLYAGVTYPDTEPGFKKSSETLAVIARLILQEYKRGSLRRIDSIITLNADDLLEQAVHVVDNMRKMSFFNDIVRVHARSVHSFLGGPKRRAIPIYHIHGFLPSKKRDRLYADAFDHMLIFTDTQYWSMSASSMSFANRIMSHALGEGRCLFIGLSMTDINLLRWMGLGSYEKDRDLIAATKANVSKLQQVTIGKGYERHCWIRPAKDDPSGFLSEFLQLRGVNSVEIKDWKGEGFQQLMKACFPNRK